ncbi:MAG: hypothetical protein IIB66_06870 [Proteobacteria bacterium]|nr:hypothetical protein [Pseudomonadota bacterium]
MNRPSPRLRQLAPFLALLGVAGSFVIGVALIAIFAVLDSSPVGPLASCFDFAEEQTGAAGSPACAPFILPDGEAIRLLETMELRPLSSGFYLVADEESWAEISKTEIWRTISAVLSAVLAVHGENPDVYFIVTPASRGESTLLLEGKYPEERMVATALFEKRTTKRLKYGDVPEGHFARIYSLNVR